MKPAPFLLAAFVGCQSMTAPDAVDIVEAEFAIAQAKVAGGYTIRALAISVGDFSWRKSYGAFDCGGQEANGCFHTRGRLIEWNVYTPSVIRHEAGHGILFVLGDDGWKCFEHGC